MSHSTIGDQLRGQIAEFCATTGVPGYVAGVHHGEDRVVVAHGIANVATAAPMRADTGFLIGSITKMLTTTLVLRQVERGTIDLDAPVRTYLPEFDLATPGVAERITIRHLLTHTNGIDADLYFPSGEGPGAVRTFVDGLPGAVGALFEPGEHTSYSNGGMIVAGRVLEAVTGTSYHDLLHRELFDPIGMTGACTSAEQAILRDTAVGHFPDTETGRARRTALFKLPDTWAPAGASVTATIDDLLAFGRTHLAGGVAPTGTRVLSAESVARMAERATTTPHITPVGLGWLLMSFGDLTLLSHSGSSAGGVAVLIVAPEHDLVFAAFGNDPRALELHDRILLWLVRERLGAEVPVPIADPGAVTDLSRYVGVYRSNQLRVEVREVDGQLEETITYEPSDPDQERIFTAFAGGFLDAPPRRYVPVGPDVFAPAGMPSAALAGYSRQLLISYHGGDASAAALRCAGGRMSRRVPA
ncbi:serine hydrolase domain-containing protein [Nocardia sp. NPDC004068]|uniref:serine hydrolase domain-containing protein n=1 Tax=Nocardia sp. NPDC004068 TaxID=3364303 RepID=UPI0036AB340F